MRKPSINSPSVPHARRLQHPEGVVAPPGPQAPRR